MVDVSSSFFCLVGVNLFVVFLYFVVLFYLLFYNYKHFSFEKNNN